MIFWPAWFMSVLKMASKAQTDLPVPTAAPRNSDSLEWYSELNVCVWMALSCCRPRLASSDSACGQLSAFKGSGCRSSSSVGGQNFSGRIRFLKEIWVL